MQQADGAGVRSTCRVLMVPFDVSQTCSGKAGMGEPRRNTSSGS